ncbi:hypothetical protein CJ255_11810 [Candidatus Viridilinea mediisalina]|uniref:Uncharacterized protein n=1 Tax=Candidatus Viridilinea mediisalina TaxID=2024553 RepID=A0A2A6RID0_9CHLR|nr:hypothetical protein CJ255_11810 [Candidatus Viridilinea mediisalina]
MVVLILDLMYISASNPDVRGRSASSVIDNIIGIFLFLLINFSMIILPIISFCTIFLSIVRKSRLIIIVPFIFLNLFIISRFVQAFQFTSFEFIGLVILIFALFSVINLLISTIYIVIKSFKENVLMGLIALFFPLGFIIVPLFNLPKFKSVLVYWSVSFAISLTLLITTMIFVPNILQ